MADREVNDDILPEKQPHEEQQDDDTEIETNIPKNVRTYTLCKEIFALRA